ncbi:60S ribosomal protein L2, mitochondrial [Suhomyces tanzawaensis NRRL Y-17324]|uniref:Large ribosomal subunit protein bL27m n=1 Tax=Suhomyces tanzawaensis NRRL Y-17324 TaxID=984487 RepID=A0A1E4SEG3_9ASCO|nr:60S ribosomal protein L2, mitochondrial [Suhomyces tanzawaensis NRRL Y-17324]ODV77782.1 60S ribosomal protein L2, mitochondrial [Suhomyces tanzawaensis NRRL Y-17324]
MSFLKSISGLIRPLNGQGSILHTSSLNNITQIRTATKKVSGSKTNKNDSAGRRLGPKAYEGHYVQPGQIIMRQRGTKIHPGENVKIGVDHTIYAVEPGYVRFYYNPFHPLRKYVGVALKQELKLPTPHFSPRVRRFGYVELTDPVKAQQEEDRMSRKEYEAQSELTNEFLKSEEYRQNVTKEFAQSLKDEFSIDLDENKLQVVAHRFYEISQLVKNGLSLEEAKVQASYNHIYNIELAARRGEVSNFEEAKKENLSVFNDIDNKVQLDAQGRLCKYLNAQERESLQQEISTKLAPFANRILSKEDKKTVTNLIETPGAYTTSEQSLLREQYLPEIVPWTVPGSVIENIDPENPPKDVVVQRVFDGKTRSTKVIGRPRDIVA